MCRRKPGPRCPSCQYKALASIQGRLEKAVAAIDEAPAGQRRARLEADALDLARQVACRRADLYATPAFQRETLAEIEHLVAQNPKDPTIGKLADQLVEGRIMDRYRRTQHALMPPLPASKNAQSYHHQLGNARFDMAHAQLRMDLSRGRRAEFQEWQKRHHDAAQRAALATARMNAVAEHGPAGWESLTTDQRRARRDAIAQDPSLATPAAPRRWSDVVEETQDLIDGITPVREPVDDTGYRPYGDPAPQRISVDKEPSKTAGTSLKAPVTETSSAEPDTKPPEESAHRAYLRGSSADLDAQTRRRAKRRRGARSAWKSLQADQRRMETSLTKVDQRIDELTPAPQYDSSVFDLTLLSFLSEKVSGR